MEPDNSELTVVSIAENKAREVCIIAGNARSFTELEIYLIVDSHSYGETLVLLQTLNPQEILISDALKHSTLSRKIELQFGSGNPASTIRVVFISRQNFDQDRGALMLKSCVLGGMDSDLMSRYTVLAAAYCLLRYIENVQGITFGSRSLKVTYATSSRNRCIIDRGTAANLELISSLRDGNQRESLFGVLNRTKTKTGARFLKSQILRPSADLLTLQTRFKVVEMFTGDSGLMAQTAKLLGSLPDMDRMLSGLTQVPKSLTQVTVKQSIDALIMLKSVCGIASELASLLETSDAFRPPPPPQSATEPRWRSSDEVRALVKLIVVSCSKPILKKIEEMISSLLTGSTKFSKSAIEMRNQECFAIQSGVSGLLDAHRKTFIQTVEDLYEEVGRLGEELGRATKVVFTIGRGYHIHVGLDDTNGEGLPPMFVQQVKNKKTISCSTIETNSLSDRANEAIAAALCITDALLRDTMEDLRTSAGIEEIFTMVDALSLLDMLRSFAEVSSTSTPQFVCPELTDEPTGGSLIIQQGRHPIVSTLHSQQRVGGFVANDAAITPLLNFQIVNGINGSGKTVYIKQCALLVIMAQIGCFVPAIAATIPLRDRVLSRMGSSDDIENNLSSFLTEMKDNAYILSNMTNRSLIIIDELGRGTSNIDGLSIAFSVAEALAATQAFTLFVTHYPQMGMLEKMYPGVRCLHLEAHIDMMDSDTDRVRMLHRVKNGVNDVAYGYGIRMAGQVGFPQRIVEDARNLQEIVRSEFPQLIESQSVDTSSVTILQTLSHLRSLSSLDDSNLRVYLRELRGRLNDATSTKMINLLNQLNFTDPSASASRHENSFDLQMVEAEEHTEASRNPKRALNETNEDDCIENEDLELDGLQNEVPASGRHEPETPSKLSDREVSQRGTSGLDYE